MRNGHKLFHNIKNCILKLTGFPIALKLNCIPNKLNRIENERKRVELQQNYINILPI